MIQREPDNGVTVLPLDHGKANALGLELCRALNGAIGDVEADVAKGFASVVRPRTGVAAFHTTGALAGRSAAEAGTGRMEFAMPGPTIGS